MNLVRTPEGGIQPQAAVDGEGVLHLIYYKGDSRGGDIFYVRQEPGQETFSKPIQVNSQPQSAAAAATIRGAQLATGKNGRVHVAWNDHAPSSHATSDHAPTDHAPDGHSPGGLKVAIYDLGVHRANNLQCCSRISVHFGTGSVVTRS